MSEKTPVLSIDGLHVGIDGTPILHGIDLKIKPERFMQLWVGMEAVRLLLPAP